MSSPNTTSVRKTNADVVTDGLKHEPEGVETITIQPVESVRKHSFYDLFRSELKLMCRSVPLWWQRRDDFVSAFPVCASQFNESISTYDLAMVDPFAGFSRSEKAAVVFQPSPL